MVDTSLSRLSSVTTVLHPVVTTSDLGQALLFYRDLLGMTVVADAEHDPEILGNLNGLDHPTARAVLLIASDGTELELVEFYRPRGKSQCTRTWTDAGISSIAFCVDNLDTLGARLLTAGFSFATPVVRYALGGLPPVRVVYCAGPHGVTLTFVERPTTTESVG